MPPHKQLRVLIVDDEASVRELISELARYAGHNVVGTAQNGVEAVARAAHLRPDVVVMDVHMPQMNGIAAMQAILAAGTASRVLLVSGGYNRETLPLNLAEFPSVAYLPKPFDVSAFVQRLDAWGTELS